MKSSGQEHIFAFGLVGCLMAYLRLLRFPALFTTFPDVLAGYAIVSMLAIQTWDLTWLLVASGLLYLSGMVFNDVFDIEQDRQERPNRPLPAGEISRTRAAWLGVLLMLGGIVAAALVSIPSLIIALLLACTILAYDAGGKKTVIGPVLMGLCRSWNLLLGASFALGSPETEIQWPLICAGLIGLYIVGVTVFARNEATESGQGTLAWGSSLIILALAGWGTAAIWHESQPNSRLVLILLAIITFQLTRRVLPVLRQPEPRRVQQAVRFMLIIIPMLEAMVILAHGAPHTVPLAIASALLMLPGQILSRLIPIT